MIITDEDAFICDMAETYGIFDFWSMPAGLIATLACGLRDDSRIMTKMNEMKMPLEEYLLAAIFDAVNWLCWINTKDAQRGGSPPDRILSTLLEKPKEQEQSDFMVFGSVEEFERVRSEILGENNG